ncbi:hypothetical protein AMAG_07735 [Allomyces macrogynus ATCC 38327]|uniref:chitin synthase n=1 Tax=Allomyces macrogynus (strain ATCC 38327) TaxID=578462 RepID=A0A0L0SJ49_ALLM3|nr:hypothetical protein AMAG_07735 [Allomyces macrogynus ATCC 38327]|eukprot:KNE62523.1 hypothetical protein AMAG_07735 [Allomyces macrogynus ATCC 38327]
MSSMRGTGGGGGGPDRTGTVMDLARDLSDTPSLDSVTAALSVRFNCSQWATRVGSGGAALVTVAAPQTPVLASGVATEALITDWTRRFDHDIHGHVGDDDAAHHHHHHHGREPELAASAATLASPVHVDAPVLANPAPHVFQSVNDALFHAKRAGKSQVLVFRGKDAANQLNLSLEHLLRIARLGRSSGGRFCRKVMAAHRALQLLGSSVADTATWTLQQGFTATMALQLDAKSPHHRVLGLVFRPFNLDKTMAVPTAADRPPLFLLHHMLKTNNTDLRAKLLLPDGFTSPACPGVVAGTPTTTSGAEEACMKAWTDALDALGCSKRTKMALARVAAGILHLATLEFGEARERAAATQTVNQGAAFVRNSKNLEAAAAVLGLSVEKLEGVLTSEMRHVAGDRVSVLLDATQAATRVRVVAAHLYHVLFQWFVGVVNDKLVVHHVGKGEKKRKSVVLPDSSNATLEVQLVQVPEPVLNATAVEHLVNNYFVESLDRFTQRTLFDAPLAEAKKQGVSGVEKTKYRSNEDVFAIFDDRHGGLIPALQEATAHKIKDVANVPEHWIDTCINRHVAAATASGSSNSRKGSKGNLIQRVDCKTVAVHHGFGKATYHVDNFLDENLALLTLDVVKLFRGSDFVELADLFTSAVLMKLAGSTLDPLNGAPIGDQIGTIKGRKGKSKKKDTPEHPTLTNLTTKDLVSLLMALAKSTARFVFAIQHNSVATAVAFDETHVREQVTELNLVALCKHLAQPALDLQCTVAADECTRKYRAVLPLLPVPPPGLPDGGASSASDMQRIFDVAHLVAGKDFTVNGTNVVLPFRSWYSLECLLVLREVERKAAAAEARRLRRERRGSSGSTTFSDVDDSSDGESVFSDVEGASVADESVYGGTNADMMGNISARAKLVAALDGDMDTKGSGDAKKPDVKEVPMSRQRRQWVAYTWFMTWWIPTPLLRWCGGMDRPDIQQAWREKMAICFGIMFVCAVQLFMIIGFGRVICPKQNIYNLEELYYKNTLDQPFAGIYGGVYDLNAVVQFGSYHPKDLVLAYAGLDLTAGFPRFPADYCAYAQQNVPDFPAFFDLAKTVANGTLIQVRHQQFYQQGRQKAQLAIDIRLKSMTKAYVGYSAEEIKAMSNANLERPRTMFSINDVVYDLQPYRDAMPNSKTDFWPAGILDYLVSKAGTDLTNDKAFMAIWNKDKDLRTCFNNLLLVGVVDYRKSPKCLVTNYVLLGFSCVLMAVIFVKFLAALQLGSRPEPEEFDKFVIMQVPCYTEGEESLRKTIDSLATTTYDDKRKLLFIVCDGNIIGSGNDRSTPRIVLDILGVDRSVDPEPLSFQSLGEGIKQHNMGKVYSGLYEIQGHLVPYLVIVKVGRPTETNRPGNRGKRDSQMILMRFLNRVYLEKAMSPLELEMYHHLKNVIGINPALYEAMLCVDADTRIFPDSLTRLMAVMIHDKKVLGVCGETRLANEKDTIITMIQVYEYYISHHMAKAFESLFGSVTCLPGCFSMYRLRSPHRNAPMLVADQIIQEYGDCDVNTLHKKNLLHLGEDRYLTTLLLKHFSNMRTVFTADAQCETIAPDRWDVLVSQRRRWINSTIHNLVELLDIPQLCGFCLFSMRFVVFIDLFATFVQPAIVAYLGFLIYLVIDSVNNQDYGEFPMLSLILLAAMYGVQAVIFLLKREWSHVVWMIIYLLSIPIFSFFIPVYSFLHMDDFSWGNTRVVVGDNGKMQVFIAGDEEKFDLSMIPHRKWAEFEQELLEAQSQSSETLSDQGGVAHLPLDAYTSPTPRVSQALSLYMPPLEFGPASPLLPAAGSPHAYAEHAQLAQAPTPPPLQQPQPHSPSTTTGFAAHPRSSVLQRSLANSPARQSTGSLTQLYMHTHSPVHGSPVTMVTPPTPASSASVDAAGRAIPTNEQLMAGVQTILAGADLMTITKKQVRDQLAVMFGGVDLRSRRDAINGMIAKVLEGK